MTEQVLTAVKALVKETMILICVVSFMKPPAFIVSIETLHCD